MTDKNLCKRDAIEEVRKSSGGDMESLSEEITIFKTEIKEEFYDFETPVVDMEFVSVKEEQISSPVNSFVNENLELAESTEQSSNGKLDAGDLEIAEGDLQSNKYRCEVCHSDFDNEIYLKSHQCYFSKEKLTNRRIHFKQNNAGEGYNCAHCMFSTPIRSNFIKHVRIHAKDKMFKCTYKNCRCTSGQDESCECNICEYAAARKSSLEIHILAKHSTKPKRYECRYCKFASHAKPNLLVHSRIHADERPFKCTYKNCDCTPGQKKTCVCDMCDYAAARKRNLTEHILAKHSKEPKRYKCTECEYAAHKKTDLVLHTRSAHTNEKPFKCTYKNCKCTPGQEESCECTLCEYATRRKTHLKLHVLARHSAEPKKYKCSDCKYASHTKANLVVHIRIHTNERT